MILLAWAAAPMVGAGCTGSSDVVVKDTSGVKNKRTSRIEQVKNGQIGAGAKKP